MVCDPQTFVMTSQEGHEYVSEILKLSCKFDDNANLVDGKKSYENPSKLKSN